VRRATRLTHRERRRTSRFYTAPGRGGDRQRLLRPVPMRQETSPVLVGVSSPILSPYAIGDLPPWRPVGRDACVPSAGDEAALHGAVQLRLGPRKAVCDPHEPDAALTTFVCLGCLLDVELMRELCPHPHMRASAIHAGTGKIRASRRGRPHPFSCGVCLRLSSSATLVTSTHRSPDLALSHEAGHETMITAVTSCSRHRRLFGASSGSASCEVSVGPE
jgi:hypothetical protein